MSYFTRTGLIPAVTNSSSTKGRYEQLLETPENLHLSLVIPVVPSVRPPVQERFHIHPYSKNCSILCNHPIVDSTTKKRINETKELLKKGGRGSNKGVQFDYYDDVHYALDNPEQIFVPEILFRRYTQTDSRPPTPRMDNHSCYSDRLPSSKQTSAFLSRRCVTPDDQHLSEAPERTRLILDLRKCLSQSTLTLREKCVQDQEDHSINTRFVSNNTNNVARNRRKKPLLSSEITKYKYFSRKKCNQEPKKYVLMKKYNLSYVLPAEANNLRKETGKPKKYKKKPPKHKIRKRREKKNDFGIKDFDENLETEVVSTKGKPSTIARDAALEKYADGVQTQERAENEIHSSECGSSTADFPDLDKRDTNEEHIKLLLKEVDPDVLERDIGIDKFNKFMKGNEFVADWGHDIDITALNKKYEWGISESKTKRTSSVHSTIVNPNQLEAPTSPPPSELFRIISRRNARFTLPFDKTVLEGTRPLEYLQRYVHVSDTCRNVYNRIFEMYATKMKNQRETSEAEPIFLNTLDNFKDALRCAMGKNFQEEEWTNLLRLLTLNTNGDVQIELRTWYGICALCERTYGDRLSFEYRSKKEDPCHEIEKADFEFLDRKLTNLVIGTELKEILFIIRDS